MRKGQLLGVGNTARVYEWGASEAIKIFHLREGAREEAMKEARNAEIVSRLSVKAPRFSGMIEYEGKTCLLYEKVEGPTMLEYIQPTKSDVTEYARLMAQLQAELHAAEFDVRPNLKFELAARIRHTPVIAESDKAAALGMLESLPEGNALCHYDLHPGNIILSPKGPVIIDWMNALVGDPLADVARSFMMLSSSALPPQAPAWLTERALRDMFAEAYVVEYARLTGIDRSSLDGWLVPTLAARICEMRGQEQVEIVNRLQAAIHPS
ncbi:phosphotransferase family protein [Paenibacillus methanolicus]|uniref:Aminoglycoside phosphotransferase (APT) family kinase protein n=1 Tax=Paenibacillus methanolicus TaxID=582686 RepID=A0A5S5C5J4_9BACL|nr:aminoglycoside phosphotransferase family protein [Paenibacillus methanolicus]TYP73233.1 aminoglycoside phosphotransferase (APT) family kinase protein [Paenibacillus methanolicus]